MLVKQISVFIENTRGSLSRLTGALGDAGVDLMALSVADTADYGIIRCITGDPQKGIEALKHEGYTVRTTDVLAVVVPDKPGGLAKVLRALEKGNVSVEYLYSFVRTLGNGALIIFRVTETDRAIAVLRENGIHMLTQEEVSRL
ncbi:MAG: ACT domain-containing protein [Eubacteriales bacterium]|nr:ACT domain-containing protein [Eubacteriales bacterium]